MIRIFKFYRGSLHIENTILDDQGKYVCVAKNDMGVSVSRSARMTLIQNIPRLQTRYDAVYYQQEEIIMHCLISGNPKPQIVWYFNGDPYNVNSDRSHIFENGSIIIKKPVENDEGTYKCQSRNFLGNTSTISLYILSGESTLFFFTNFSI